MSDDEAEARTPSPVSREQFLEWRSPRVGAENPQVMSNPVWAWLIESRLSAWSASKAHDGPSALGAGPGWCFERFGQSTTELPDGRVVLVAGEHEDYYDPDFYIYNDVVVRHPDGRLDILGYPHEVFPPTDFHSATLVGDRLILIGNLGYQRDRRPGVTQVLALDLRTMAIAAVETGGTPPGWIHDHTATLVDDGRAILVQRGKLERGGDEPLIENIDDWRFDLGDWQWQRLTERRWPRRDVQRADGKRNHIFELQQAVWSRDADWHDHLAESLASLTEELGAPPDLDLVEQLFRPPVPHTRLAEDEDEYDTTRVTVDGVLVRYVYSGYSVQMTVEGDLPEETVEALTNALRDTLSALERAACVAKPL